jgi:hypothetical protein
MSQNLHRPEQSGRNQRRLFIVWIMRAESVTAGLKFFPGKKTGRTFHVARVFISKLLITLKTAVAPSSMAIHDGQNDMMC